MQTILIIEDEQVLADVLSQKLRGVGFAVQTVRDGQEGFDAIRAVRPALVILDIFLPSLNGIEILGKKRQDPEIADIPVIVLSNSLQPIEGKTLESLGAIKFFIKADLQPEEILRQVQQVLKTDVELKMAAPDGSTFNLTGRHVFLVEDDDFLSTILTNRIEAVGAQVTHAATGEAALEKLAGAKPDIVLLDILLPGISGFDVLEKLRADAATKDLPVVIVSNFNQSSDMERARSLGASYLVKAMASPDDIVVKIGETLKAAQSA